MSDRPEKINLSDVHSRQVDTDLLNELRELFVKAEEQKERYDFTWNGKAKAYFEAAAPTTKTLRAQPEESVDFEKSENLFITGDNLEALKLLQESYLGKIDMIYIDPPYNTGKDFVYQDNFKKTQKENDVSEGIIDEAGNRLVKNEKSNGRYHSDWLTMMYPRLKLARNLLSNEGAIFISIDENEYANLKILMDSIFGENNFIENIVWNKKSSAKGVPPTNMMAGVHEYILSFQKTHGYKFIGVERNLEEDGFKNPDNDPRGPWRESNIRSTTISTDKAFTIENPKTGEKYTNTWAFSRDSLKKMIETKRIIWKKTLPKQKEFMYEMRNENKAIISNFGLFDAQINTVYLKKLLGFEKVFSNPKPLQLMKYLISVSLKKESTVLDFFAGSGTTADAVMQLNAKDGGNRKFIVATLDEETPENSEARKAGYTTIDQISRERIRRAAEKIGDTSGFRALKLDSTGLKEDVFKTAGDLDQVDLLEDIDNHSDNRSDYDLLYDVLVDSALEYNRPITIDTTNDEQIIKYDYFGELSGVVCYFGENLTDELTRQIATLKPLIVVFKESTFDKSAQKVNVMEQFRIISPDTKVKVI
ncbi:site-specific DNA-methyltransferase [Lactococcus piscium]|uniref:site-specific DNA-methyltransferase n=1 Tax=Pseudolactococcus carnosus TaxID=2749961 RepID=UPI001FB906DD|nr:site-specific DNA-methyltransferase [Lactococcus carnosus]MCJ1992815.1 site-specific DNA-methyltransferase [Lactococcus carnosus]